MPTDNNSSYKAARLALVEADSALRRLGQGLLEVADDPEFTDDQRSGARQRGEEILRLADRVRNLQSELLEITSLHRLPESMADLRQAE
jgi:hypothetical protein